LIHVLHQKATRQQLDEMLEELDPLIKLAVDIRRNMLAGGGQMHADCEAVLIETGSRQADIWAQIGFRSRKQ
jgi:head-tail adaptor